ncbi:MAG: SIMPL domain-containing protein [Bacteroidetes bacterium]|nr:SIMPL domain-containing protein [Bacteroidota bacterium]
MQTIKAVVLTTLLGLMTNLNMAQQTTTPEQRKIEVTGSAKMEVIPDEIYVNITVQEYTENKKKVDINDIRKDFLSACTKAGIAKENISIQGMNGYNNTGWYWQRKKKSPDFMASSTFIIKFSSGEQIEKLMSLLDDKSTQNMYISSTSYSKLEDLKKQVKILALQNARSKAQYMCEAIGEKAGKVLLIKEVESNSYVPQPMMMEKRMMSAAPMADEFEPSGLEFQKITINMEVLAQFAIQ